MGGCLRLRTFHPTKEGLILESCHLSFHHIITKAHTKLRQDEEKDSIGLDLPLIMKFI